MELEHAGLAGGSTSEKDPVTRFLRSAFSPAGRFPGLHASGWWLRFEDPLHDPGPSPHADKERTDPRASGKRHQSGPGGATRPATRVLEHLRAPLQARLLSFATDTALVRDRSARLRFLPPGPRVDSRCGRPPGFEQKKTDGDSSGVTRRFSRCVPNSCVTRRVRARKSKPPLELWVGSVHQGEGGWRGAEPDGRVARFRAAERWRSWGCLSILQARRPDTKRDTWMGRMVEGEYRGQARFRRHELPRWDLASPKLRRPSWGRASGFVCPARACGSLVAGTRACPSPNSTSGTISRRRTP